MKFCLYALLLAIAMQSSDAAGLRGQEEVVSHWI